MTYRITAPNKVDALINLPASKSISNRALIIHALSGGAIMPENLSHCDDTDVMRAALSNMPDVIDIGAAGTAMRFLTALLSTTEGQHTITGTERMKQRPITVLVDALRKLGADIEYEENEGFPPLRINGRQLLGGELQMPGNVSSQYVSALLMVGAVLQRGLTLHLTGEVISRPYIDLTLSMMRHYGAEAAWESDNTITVKSTGYQDRPFLIENDWSAASYWYAIMALTADDSSTVSLPGLFDGSQQGDSVVRFLYSMMGVKTSFADGGVVLTKHASNLPRIDYDFSGTPDLAQTLVTTCCALGVKFHFKGLSTLKIKETDRIEALRTELGKLGFAIEERNDSELLWDGERHEPAADTRIDTYNDHRMAMAIAPMAMKLGPVCINNPEVVTKSYPDYWDHLRLAGFTIEEL